MQRVHRDDPDGMRKKAQELREKACLCEKPGYAEQLVQAAQDLEDYADELERRG